MTPEDKNLIEELVNALEAMIDHAQEKYPHFESQRGQDDIERAKKAVDDANIRLY